MGCPQRGREVELPVGGHASLPRQTPSQETRPELESPAPSPINTRALSVSLSLSLSPTVACLLSRPILSPLRLCHPHPGAPGWQSLCPGAASPPPDPTGSVSGATPTPAAFCQQRLWPFLHTDHGAGRRVPWPATSDGCRAAGARAPAGRLWSGQWGPGSWARDGHP